MERDELIARIEAGENTYALEQDIGNFFNPMYAGPNRNWPAYLNSLDAAVALCERVRPGVWREMRGPRSTLPEHTIDVMPSEWRVVFQFKGRPYSAVGDAPTLAGALLAALLRSMEG
jgi:hypothetical protein